MVTIEISLKGHVMNAQKSLLNDSASATETVLPLGGSRHSQSNHMDMTRYATLALQKT